MAAAFDSVLLIAFGGPTRPEEVRPFLANVTRGRAIPPERLEAVAHHYDLMGGYSPFNELTLRQARALEVELRDQHLLLPVFVGMRNWHPFLRETFTQMSERHRRRTVGVILAAQQCEASWEQYKENVAEARDAVGTAAPEVNYAPPWSDHPLFIEAVADRAAAALQSIAAAARGATPVVFTGHSIPVAMAERSPYVEQIREGARLVAERLRHTRWSVAYQSRSGNPRDPWLEPDIGEALRALAREGAAQVVVVPIGFVCDHVEVLYDLDIEARAIADGLGMGFVRAAAVNDHPAFVRMLADLVRRTVGKQGPG